MNPAQNPAEPAGIPCPECKSRIEVKIEDLLKRSYFRCKTCGLELTLNRFQSRESLQALQKLQGAIETLQSIKQQYKDTSHGK